MLKYESTENYLKAIYTLELPNQLVAFKGIVDALGVTAGTATTMMKRLAQRGLVSYKARKGVALTALGRTQALRVIRRHRLLELFLVKKLGFNWSEVHDEAEVLEHVISERVLQRIDHLLGYPMVDPHGAPIPSSNGKVPRQKQCVSLAQCRKNQKKVLQRVASEDAGLLTFLDQQKIALGDTVTVVSNDPHSGIIEIRLTNGRLSRLSLLVANSLLVSA